MADPSAIVPYIDPYDRPLTDNFNFLNDSLPTLDQISSSFALPTSPDMAAVAHFLEDDPFEDKTAWDMPDESNNTGAGNTYSQAAGPSESAGNGGNARPLFAWPVAPIPYNCSCCHVLREIIYRTGIFFYMRICFNLVVIYMKLLIKLITEICPIYIRRDQYQET